jgi:hypothetical protein
MIPLGVALALKGAAFFALGGFYIFHSSIPLQYDWNEVIRQEDLIQKFYSKTSRQAHVGIQSLR